MAGRAAEIRYLEATEDGRGYLIEIVGGPQSGDLVFIPGPPPSALSGGNGYLAPPRRFADLSPTEKREAQATAERLLLALLDEEQQAEYRATGGFWVELADGGRLRLGTLYHLIWRPASGPDYERVLCVVPEGHDEGLTPPADIWTNLLLTLLGQPDQFFAVANVLRVTRHDGRHGVPTFSSLGVGELSVLARSHYRHGDWWNGALAEHELARRLSARGRRRDAAKCAIPAALTCAVVEPPQGSPAEFRRTAAATAARLAAYCWETPGLIDDIMELAGNRLGSRRPDLAGRIDTARCELSLRLAPAAK